MAHSVGSRGVILHNYSAGVIAWFSSVPSEVAVASCNIFHYSGSSCDSVSAVGRQLRRDNILGLGTDGTLNALSVSTLAKDSLEGLK